MRRVLVTALLALLAGLLAAPAATAEEIQALRGTLAGPNGDPVQGVTITVVKGGEQLGESTTDGDGKWEVELPEPGRYDVVLDVDNLPEGVVPREKGGGRLSGVAVRPGQQRTVIFPLTTPEKQQTPGKQPSPSATQQPRQPAEGGGPGLDQVLQLLVEGIQYGMIIAITSIGLSLIFGTTGLINFAHGELVTLGAVLAFLFNAAAVGPGLHLIPAAAIAVILGGAFGGGLERTLWRPLRRRGTGRIQLFIISIGLSLFLRHLILVLFGSRPQPYADYALQQPIRFGPVSSTPRDLVITLASIAVLVGVGVMLQRTRIGKAMRAVAENRDLAESSGIDVARVIMIVWVLGAGLAALGGVFYGLTEVVAWDMGFNLLLLMFAGVILGGLGTAYGAVVGSLFVGIVAQMSTLWFPIELQNAWALGILILVLLVRPQGILGRAERVG